jgi:hypothetical protein
VGFDDRLDTRVPDSQGEIDAVEQSLLFEVRGKSSRLAPEINLAAAVSKRPQAGRCR